MRQMMEWKKQALGLTAVWKSDPEISAIEKIVCEHLRLQDDEPVRVSFFDEGGFNKLYKVSTKTQGLIFRAAVPLYPHWKTESEVSTMRFVQDRTNIPTPHVLAHESSASNELGYEWILMELVNGSPLYRKWRHMSVDAKERLVKQLAKGNCELMEPANRFNGIGSIFAVSCPRQMDKHDQGATYGLGKIVAPDFWLRECTDPSGSYGPLSSTTAWLNGRMGAHIEAQEYYEEICDDEDDLEEANDSIALTEALQDLIAERPLPAIELEQTALRHSDLSFSNILVDDEGRVAAVIDWESTVAEPLWPATQYPLFLKMRERHVKPERNDYGEYDPSVYASGCTPLDQGDNEGMCDDYWEHLMEYELTQMRKLYDSEMELHMPGFTKLKEDHATTVDYSTAITALNNYFAHYYLNKWLIAVQDGTGLSCQEVLKAGVGGSLDAEEGEVTIGHSIAES